MQLHDNWCLENLSCHDRGYETMACYAVELAHVSNLASKQIKASTIRLYLRQVASFLLLFDGCARDYTKDPSDPQKWHPRITATLNELTRWEQMPDKKEPYTPSMLDWQRDHASSFASSSIEAAIADWAELGLFAGLRGGEWCQPSQHSGLSHYTLAIDGSSLTFTLNDFTFMDNRGGVLSLSAVLRDPSKAMRVRVTWRWQKNQNNGESQVYSRTHATMERNAVAPCIRIVTRFVTLLGPSASHLPVAIFRDHTGQTRYIWRDLAERHIRQAASAVYSIPTRSKTLLAWTAHSFRIGAAVILHDGGQPGAFIQKKLRWRSNSFMEYLRNTLRTAATHLHAVNAAVTADRSPDGPAPFIRTT